MKLLKWNSCSKTSAESSHCRWTTCEMLSLQSAELHTFFFPPLTFTKCGATTKTAQPTLQLHFFTLSSNSDGGMGEARTTL